MMNRGLLCNITERLLVAVHHTLLLRAIYQDEMNNTFIRFEGWLGGCCAVTKHQLFLGPH